MAKIKKTMTVSLEELGKKAGEYALDEYEYKGLTIRQWADKIASGEYQPVKNGYWIEYERLIGIFGTLCDYMVDNGRCDVFCPYAKTKDKNDECEAWRTIHKIRRESVNKETPNQECTLCCRYGIEKGDTLYQVAYPDSGIDFYAIYNIKYCPLCGKELKDDNT